MVIAAALPSAPGRCDVPEEISGSLRWLSTLGQRYVR
jgi:hypothetical protein